MRLLGLWFPQVEENARVPDPWTALRLPIL